VIYNGVEMIDFKIKYEKLINNNPEYIGIERYCNICGYRFAKFSEVGMTPREGRCPVCGSIERHRHLYIHLLSIFSTLKNKKILHFAPEKIFFDLLKNSTAEYYDADIEQDRASYVENIENISFEDNYFDYIIAIHVLEHIEDDIKALNEIYRVLKLGGIAYLCVPTADKHLENPLIISPADRLKYFGQEDHVRIYSKELFFKRIKCAGFEASYSAPDNFPLNLQRECKLSNYIFLAKKI
jgi:SAM-dependent methyltransferase